MDTITNGSEIFATAGVYLEQNIVIRNTLRYIGLPSLPIGDRSYMFGDKKLVFNSSMLFDV